MTVARETRAFRAAIYVACTLPIVVGLTGAFGGLEGLARLFHDHDAIAMSPALRNDLRAICWLFVLVAALLVWSIRDLVARAAVFRIVAVVAAMAGFARLTGIAVDGRPGGAEFAILGVELVLVPALILWHATLVRRLRGAT